MSAEPPSEATILRRIGAALEEEGKGFSCLKLEDLAPVDQFHIGGSRESAELLARSGIQPGWRVLDIGCGLGGPARMLAQHGCIVAAADQSAAFCEAASELTRCVGLVDRISVVRADAVCLPFASGGSGSPRTKVQTGLSALHPASHPAAADESWRGFDAVWLQHVNMNVVDKQSLFSEIARALRPGGVLALHEVCQGEGGDVLYPTPWTSKSEESCLASPSELQEMVAYAGLDVLSFEDRTEHSAQWFQGMLAGAERHGPRPLGIHLVLGPETPKIMSNMVRNLAEGRVRVVMGAASKPSRL